MDATLAATIRDRVIVDAEGCWRWQGAITTKGYGSYGSRGSAHRASYEATIGPIPAGLELDHLCAVRDCVNPAHLEAVTHQENMRRMGRLRWNQCAQGHELTASNTYRKAGTERRECRVCKRARGARHDARHRKLLIALGESGSTLPADDPRHGTTNGYGRLRCRCTPCRAANAAAGRAYKSRTKTI